MLAMTEIPSRIEDRFASTLRAFLEHSLAIANGIAEGETFTWFLATEYQWEMEMAGEWLIGSPASRLSDSQKAILRNFLASMPEVREAITSGRRIAAAQANKSTSPQWVDWLEISSLPEWNSFTVRTAMLLSQLGRPARNDAEFAAGPRPVAPTAAGA
ncbi:MAG: hypothetical protein OQK79_03315 [Rhodanobacter sp.]|jgi:hypothetical protein|nr:hypothetical protein [Rhodanobacter sp.]